MDVGGFETNRQKWNCDQWTEAKIKLMYVGRNKEQGESFITRSPQEYTSFEGQHHH